MSYKNWKKDLPQKPRDQVLTQLIRSWRGEEKKDENQFCRFICAI
jgi:hypothetical protein